LVETSLHLCEHMQYFDISHHSVFLVLVFCLSHSLKLWLWSPCQPSSCQETWEITELENYIYNFVIIILILLGFNDSLKVCKSCKLHVIYRFKQNKENKMMFVLGFHDINTFQFRDRHGCDHMVVTFTTTFVLVQSVPITTNVVSLNPADGEVYSIQHYVIKFVSDLWQVGGFLWVLRFPPPTDHHYITEILLKVTLNTITKLPHFNLLWCSS